MLMAMQHRQLDWRLSARRRSVARGMESGGQQDEGEEQRVGEGPWLQPTAQTLAQLLGEPHLSRHKKPPNALFPLKLSFLLSF